MSVIAWLRPRAWTSRLAVFVPVDGDRAVELAFVPPGDESLRLLHVDAARRSRRRTLSSSAASALFVDVALHLGRRRPERSPWRGEPSRVGDRCARDLGVRDVDCVAAETAEREESTSTIARLLLVESTRTPPAPAVTSPSSMPSSACERRRRNRDATAPKTRRPRRRRSDASGLLEPAVNSTRREPRSRSRCRRPRAPSDRRGRLDVGELAMPR